MRVVPSRIAIPEEAPRCPAPGTSPPSLARVHGRVSGADHHASGSRVPSLSEVRRQHRLHVGDTDKAVEARHLAQTAWTAPPMVPPGMSFGNRAVRSEARKL